jgi:hypothetical protein
VVPVVAAVAIPAPPARRWAAVVAVILAAAAAAMVAWVVAEDAADAVAAAVDAAAVAAQWAAVRLYPMAACLVLPSMPDAIWLLRNQKLEHSRIFHPPDQGIRKAVVQCCRTIIGTGNNLQFDTKVKTNLIDARADHHSR